MTTTIIRILFLAATIAEDYNFKSKELGYYHSVKSINESMVKEYKRINTALMKSRYRDKFDLRFIPSATVDDAKDSLSYYEPNIVHFSGMALPADEGVPSEEDEIVEKSHILMEDEGQNVKRLSPDYLAGIFQQANSNKNIRCVVLTAPFSIRHAEKLAKYVNCVIGHNYLENRQAELFASFYQGLASGLSINNAFESTLNDIQFKFQWDDKAIEKHLPKLKFSFGVNPSTEFLF